MICLIVIASFVTFAVDQMKSASGHQREALEPTATASASSTSVPATKQPAAHKSPVHKVIDEASSGLTSPFSGVVSESSEWAVRSFKLLAALIVYGFGLGYLARTLRVRV